MSRVKIRISNISKAHRLNEVFIKGVVKKILELVEPGIAELEVVFLDDNSMRSLNRRFKNRDRSTDVLSFKIDLREFALKGFLGEIFISPDTALRNARAFKARFEDEVALYLVHGILHLAGYDDEKARARLGMSKKESYILKRLCRNEDLSKVLMPR